MKRLSRYGLLVVVAVLGISGIATADQDDCGLKTLRGTYVFAATGHNIVAGVPQPKAIVELIEFHGNGILSTPNGTLSVNGFIVRPLADNGGYTVQASCVGTIAFDGGPTFDVFFTPNADKLWMIQTNKDTVFQGIATRLSRETSHARDQH